MSTTDDEDGCSEDLDDESDVDDDDDNSDDGDDDIDGVIGKDPDRDQENDCERLRKPKDTKLVSFSGQMNCSHVHVVKHIEMKFLTNVHCP